MYWGKHLVKMLKAVDCLAKPGGTTIHEIAEKLEVDKRTAYRIRETLEELNFPIYEDDTNLDGRKRLQLDDRYLKKLPNLNIPELNLSLSELIALYFIRGNSRLFRGTEIEENIEAAFNKLDAFMPEGLSENINRIRTLFVSSAKFAKDYSAHQQTIDTLTEAILTQQTCTVKYHSFYDNKQKSFKIDPLRFFERDGGLYLFVRATSYGHIRVLAVERIEKLTVSNETFKYPDDFDPDSMLEEAFSIIYDEPIDVKIRFSADTARYIKERIWAKEQQITDNPDGSINLEMKTSGWFDVKKWVLSYGAEARIIAPPEFAAEIRDELEKASRSYRA